MLLILKKTILTVFAVVSALGLSSSYYTEREVKSSFTSYTYVPNPNPNPRLLKEEIAFIEIEPVITSEKKPVEVPKPAVKKSSAVKVSNTSGGSSSISQGFSSGEVNAIYSLINQYRSANGLGTLAVNSTLVRSASIKNQQMVSTQTFAHSINGASVWQTFNTVGYPYTYAGENLAEGFFNGSSTVQAWKNSPGHNANLLNANYKEMGVSTVCGVNMPGYPGTCLVTLHLGAR